MRYTVVHDPIALNALARYWMILSDRQAVSAASNEIDRLLRTMPDRCGVPFGAFRELTVHPLAALYVVSPADCMVRVVSIMLLIQP